jgi:2-polyprenyl-6-hydroxyphenyl methylase/3-demethylubiquinone-9 3-methyltransferase
MNEYYYDSSDMGASNLNCLQIIRRVIGQARGPGVLVDVGCGNGSLLGQLLDCGWELHGLDSSSSGLEIARKNYPAIKFHLADATGDLSGNRLIGACQIVLCTEVVEHVYFPRKLIDNCRDLLSEGGIAVITTPYHGYLKDLLVAVAGRMDQQYCALWDHGHIKFWSRKTITALIEERGFKVREFIGFGRMVPYLWKNMLLVVEKRSTLTG